MIKKTITYTDYNDVERTEDHYFNLSKSELMELQYSIKGGLEGFIQSIIAEDDHPKIIQKFKDLVLMSYGKKHADGRRFEKSDEIRADFEQTEAYSALFMELATDEKAAAEFVKGIMPKGVETPNSVGVPNLPANVNVKDKNMSQDELIAAMRAKLESGGESVL